MRAGIRTVLVCVLVASALPPSGATAQTTPPPEATRVLLAFTSPAPADPSDPCGGGFARFNNPGDHDELTACTYDAVGNPVATDASEARLQWSISGQTSEDPIAVRFNPSTPPEETTGAAATAAAGIDAVQGGRNYVTVTLRDGNGATIDWFSVEKEVAGGGCGAVERTERASGFETACRDVPAFLTARRGRLAIRGDVETEAECIPGRSVTLFRRGPGKDNTIGTDTTGSTGRWRVETGRPHGTYYARVAAAGATDAETGSTINCLPDQSNRV